MFISYLNDIPQSLNRIIFIIFNFRNYKKGIILVAAAGVDGRGTSVWTVDYPAQYTSVISVAAYDNNLQHPFWSSNGPANELSAPGVDILSTWTGGGYTKLSGTSMSTPYVTGMIALLMEKEHYDALETSAKKDKKNHLTPDTIRGVFQATAHDLGSIGKDDLFGFGSVHTDALFYGKPAENYFHVEFLGYGTDDDVPFGIRNTNLVEENFVDTFNIYRLQDNSTNETKRYIIADYTYKNHPVNVDSSWTGILQYVKSIGVYLPSCQNGEYDCWWDGTAIYVDDGSVNGISTNWTEFDPYSNNMPNLDSVAVNSTVHMRVVVSVAENQASQFSNLSSSGGILVRKEYWCKSGYDMYPQYTGSYCYWFKQVFQTQWKTDMGTTGSTSNAKSNPFSVTTLNYWSNDGVTLSTPMKILLGLNLSASDSDWDGLYDLEERLKGTDPARKDTDNDRLNDYFECTQNGTGGWGETGIIYAEKPDPLKKDIYVEVDWMPSNGASDPEHKLSSANLTAIWGYFNAKNIAIHIDQGNMSGGTSVTHYTSVYGEEWYRDQTAFFAQNRRNIFHYCLICHNLSTGDAGGGYMGGLSFVVAGATTSDVIKSFMHELGHNILGATSTDWGSHRDSYDDGHCYQNTCAMYKTSKTGAQNYCSDCWDDVKLTTCLSHYDGRK
ncbi:MAG: S8 family serine peptidase [Thermoplasmata archaeon]